MLTYYSKNCKCEILVLYLSKTTFSLLTKIFKKIEILDPSTPAAKKKRKTTAEDPKRQTALEICDIIISEVHHTFAFNDHLMISHREI